MTGIVTPVKRAPSGGAIGVLASLLEARTGQQLAANRSWRIETALKPLLIQLELDTVEQLLARLLEGEDSSVGDHIVDALLNQETSFFRDGVVIETAARALIEMAPPKGRRKRVWCAACASGQEPLSLAMLFAEAGLGVAAPEVLATDVSSGAIARAREGRYSQFEIQRGLPVRRMMRWFEGGADGSWTASSALLAAVTYRRHNLVTDPPPPGAFDLILCRNVLFYLSPAAREEVLARIAAALSPEGLLLLGAGETVIGQSELLRPSLRHRGFYELADQVPATARRVYTAR